ncbi:uncharacterized protein N7446_007840 [Penicillium canescens]|uniref:Uncharacterized protein n=1 Tax=Penicillium canescens TaxID=5083 RepID=A0AAD6IM51_PENCN|nr:uncharacterized protein N7446_007840 [Penicillium canescens]KAJ6033864.1 hypothetical protein N7444_011635 [Penicillium canescens]KAJ6056947.1 hypothetical protein N7460_000221 [Penicillium canescens]KAJ6058257.1 hypothetical protein N7446_007840 [Penicillium canescens]
MSSQNTRHEDVYGPLPYQQGYRTGRAAGPPGRERETTENNERAEDIYQHSEQRRFIKAHTPSHSQREILNIAYPAYGEVPLIDPSDHDFKGKRSQWALEYEAACEDGHLATVKSMVSSRKHTPLFLHSGLTYALCAGQVEVADYLLSVGAPIASSAPHNIIRAPRDTKIPLLDVLAQHGWRPVSQVCSEQILPDIVGDLPLLSWFLDHGTNPDFRPSRENFINCSALEKAAGSGSLEAVQMLVDAGADVHHDALHAAAYKKAPTKEADVDRIPVMALLVEKGADVNKKRQSPYVTHLYPIVFAAVAGAVERVKWLLEHGANPELGCPILYGNAMDVAQVKGNEEMQRVLDAGLAARKWENATA